MNNLTQTQQSAKRNALIRQIDSFLEIMPKDAKTLLAKISLQSRKIK